MIKRVITMKKSIQKTGKVLLATSIALTTLSVGSIGFSHDNQAHAKGHENPTNPKPPKNSQIKKVKAHYSKKQVKKLMISYQHLVVVYPKHLSIFQT